jgi:hypothetical protein
MPENICIGDSDIYATMKVSCNFFQVQMEGLLVIPILYVGSGLRNRRPHSYPQKWVSSSDGTIEMCVLISYLVGSLHIFHGCG